MKPLYYGDLFKPVVMQPSNIMKITNIDGPTYKTPIQLLTDIENFFYNCMELIQLPGFKEYVTQKYQIIEELRWQVIDKIIN